VGVDETCKQFGGALVLAIRVFASDEPLVVEEESEEFQVQGPDLATEREVVAKATVEVLDDGACSDDVINDIGDCLVHVVKSVSKLLADAGKFVEHLLLGHVIAVRGVEIPDRGVLGFEFSGGIGQLLIYDGRKGEELIALMFERGADWFDAMRSQIFPRPEGLSHKVEEVTSCTVVWADRSEDVFSHPSAQSEDVIGQLHGLLFSPPGRRQS